MSLLLALDLDNERQPFLLGHLLAMTCTNRTTNNLDVLLALLSATASYF